MTRRRDAVGILGWTLLLPVGAVRSQPRPVRLGWLAGTNPRTASFYVAFEKRLAELGYVDGKNLIVDFAFAEGKIERLAPLARELVAKKPDVLFVTGPEGPLKAASEATDSIPIVVAAVDFDPQAKGYVKSLARPGGNITGVHLQQIEATGKRIELLRDLVPATRRIAVLTDELTRDQLEAAQRTARLLKLELQILEVRDYPYDYALPMNAARSAQCDGVLVLMSPRFFAGRDALAAEARKQRLPTVFGLAHWVEVGGLASYGASIDAMFARAADYVVKIIKGDSPSNLPMEQPAEFDLAVNLKVAKELGIKIPQSVQIRATRSIE